MLDFLTIEPTEENYWRSLILFGRNVACYKFALGKALLSVAPGGKSVITLSELAEPYSCYVTEHLRLSDAQSQDSSAPYPFIEACRQYNRGEITKEQLIQVTEKEGFKVVLDKFHNLNDGAIPIQFFEKRRGGLTVTDDLFQLIEGEQVRDLEQEIEARWRLVETAWQLKISRNLLRVDYDADTEVIYTQSRHRRVDVTSCRDALNGYQKGKCFYCFADISIFTGTDNLADVDHFFPHKLKFFDIAPPIDGVWNLVLACPSCNRGSGGKFEKLPKQRFLERLHTRNEFFIGSHHPLKETLMQQTGRTPAQRTNFITTNYQQATTGVLINSSWQPEFEYPPAF